jgi:hypothetical protein
MISIYIVNPISLLWIQRYAFFQITPHLHLADYILYETPGDPVQSILDFKKEVPQHLHPRIVFILSGDQSSPIDDICLWYTCAVRPTGIARRQKQIFVTNPAIFRYHNPRSPEIRTARQIPIYFKGSIWPGMRTAMKEALEGRDWVLLEDYTTYWDWRFAQPRSDREIEEKAFELYQTLSQTLLSLCPKGKGNSSMRIVESIACGAVPVLIDDFSAPFGYDYSRFCLVFDTKIHSWDQIYEGCLELLRDTTRLQEYQRRGRDFYQKVVCADFADGAYYDYTRVDTVAYGFSSLIVSDLWHKWIATQSMRRAHEAP